VLANLCDGEVAQQCNRFQASLTWDAYLAKCQQKTASLFMAACESAGVVAQSSQADIDRLLAFGQAFGQAFQLTDDLLDYTATAADAGKPVMSDLRNGLLTAPVLLGMQHPTHGQAITREVTTLFGQLATDTTTDVQPVLLGLGDLLLQADCFQATRDQIEAQLQAGYAQLAVFPPEKAAALMALCRGCCPLRQGPYDHGIRYATSASTLAAGWAHWGGVTRRD
jgi:geranylgeranyl pyrophosphate synthase